MVSRAERAQSFGVLAERYDRLRPGYPRDAVDAVLAGQPEVVADVGAGTGKLTASLIGRSRAVIAVEPDQGMRSVLAARMPAVDVRAGDAEALPLGDGEVDAIVFGQSWHWVDATRAVPEAHRALSDEGTLNMIWNRLDSTVPWVAELERITGVGSTGPPAEPEDAAPELDGFGSSDLFVTRWRQAMPTPDLAELAGTWSAVSTSTDAERNAIFASIHELAASVARPASPGRAESMVELPYTCALWRYRRQ